MRIMSASPADPMTLRSKAHATTEESRSYFATSARATANSVVSNAASVIALSCALPRHCCSRGRPAYRSICQLCRYITIDHSILIDRSWLYHTRAIQYQQYADGGEPLQLTDNPSLDHFPAWSPDGTRIAFTAPIDGDKNALTDRAVFTMAADG